MSTAEHCRQNCPMTDRYLQFCNFRGTPKCAIERFWNVVLRHHLSLFHAFSSWGQRKEMWFFSRSLPSRRTPLFERLEQASISWELVYPGKDSHKLFAKESISKRYAQANLYIVRQLYTPLNSTGVERTYLKVSNSNLWPYADLLQRYPPPPKKKRQIKPHYWRTFLFFFCAEIFQSLKQVA